MKRRNSFVGCAVAATLVVPCCLRQAGAAVFVVTNTSDSGTGSLRLAILAANAAPGADTIQFHPGVFSIPQTITLHTGEILISDSLTIEAAPQAVTVSGNDSSRVFRIDGPGTIVVSMENLSIVHGWEVTNVAGGGILVADEDITLTNCVVSDCFAGAGGGGIAGGSSMLALFNCTIANNASVSGGGIAGSAAVTIVDCTFASNSAVALGGNGGGGLNCSSVNISGTTFAFNVADDAGAAMVVGSGTVRNCTISNNTAGVPGNGAGIACLSGGNLQVQNCTITQNVVQSGLGGGIYKPVSAVISIESTIVSGNEASGGGDDLSGSAFVVQHSAIGSPEGFTLDAGSGNNLIGTKIFLGPLADNGGPTLTHALLVGSLAVDAGSNPAMLSTDQRGAGYLREADAMCGGAGSPDIGAFEFQVRLDGSDCNENGIDDECDIADGTSADLNVNGIPDECDTLYVDPSASARRGAGAGHSWETAYADLQDALADAQPGQQVWVAAATYYPTNGTDRNATFALERGVEIYGGFAGDERSLDERDINANPTILSGDIGVSGDVSDNSYHVVSSAGGNPTSRLDGFTITAGRASGTDSPDFVGGGAYLVSGSPVIVNCTFLANSATGQGGGFYSTSSPMFINCRFLGNSAGSGGGGIVGAGGLTELVNCLFSGNEAVGGPGQRGGALRSNGGVITLVNCSFANNLAGNAGGALSQTGTTAISTLANCILWDNAPNEIDIGAGSPAPFVNYSDIEGGFSGRGNVNINPQFTDANGADNTAGTLDDNLRLGSGSPCIDNASNSALPSDSADIDGDSDTFEPLSLDLDGNPRVIDGDADANATVDMGTYEFVPMTPLCPADITDDGAVSAADLANLLGAWGPCPPGPCPADFDNNDFVNAADLAVLLSSWGPCPV